MNPVAIVIVGGLVSSTLLGLLVTPAPISTLNLSDCPTCEHAEYACTCEHGGDEKGYQGHNH